MKKTFGRKQRRVCYEFAFLQGIGVAATLESNSGGNTGKNTCVADSRHQVMLFRILLQAQIEVVFNSAVIINSIAD
jgi:hypothetical protein